MSKILLTQEYVNLLLDKILNNNNYNKSLEEVLLTDDSNIESVSNDDFEYYMYERIPEDIIKYDPTNALEITYDNSNIDSKTFNFDNLDYDTYIENLINGYISSNNTIFDGVFTKNKYRINNYQENKYVILDSSKLFKNILNFKSKYDKDVLLAFNANGKNAFILLKSLYEEFFKEQIPFYLVYRIKDYDDLNLQDNLTLYINHRDIDKVNNIINNISNINNLVRKPSILFENKNLYGLSYLRNNGSLVELISSVILRTLHNTFRDYNDRYHTNLDTTSNNTKVLQDNLKIIKDKDINLYNSIINNIIEYLMVLNYNKEFEIVNKDYSYKYSYDTKEEKKSNKNNTIDTKDLIEKLNYITKRLDEKTKKHTEETQVTDNEKAKDEDKGQTSVKYDKLVIDYVDLNENNNSNSKKEEEKKENNTNDDEDTYYDILAKLKEKPVVIKYLNDHKDEIDKLPDTIIDDDETMWFKQSFIDERLVPLIVESNGTITMDQVKDRYIDPSSYKVKESKKSFKKIFNFKKK